MKKAIWIIMAIVAVALISVQKKEAAAPLMITDLTGIDVTGISYRDYAVNEAYILVSGISPTEIKGQSYIANGFYVDNNEINSLQAQLNFEVLNNNILQLSDTDYIILYYDGTEKTIYLPYYNDVSFVPALQLYPASDGSTYYNKELTNLAKQAPTSDYQLFLDAKDDYIDGTDELTEFIGRANAWL